MFLVPPADRVPLKKIVSDAEAAGVIPPTAEPKWADTPERLKGTPFTTLAVAPVLLNDPVLREWMLANHEADVCALWRLPPHPDEVVKLIRQFPRITRVYLFDDVRSPTFWAGVRGQRTAIQYVGDFGDLVLHDAPLWAPEAQDTLRRIIANLRVSSLKEIAGTRYGGAQPAHQFAKILREANHAPGKRLLLVAQIAAYRYAIERGAPVEDAAKAIGRENVGVVKRVLRDTFSLFYPDFVSKPAEWWLALTREVFAARRPSVFVDAELADLIRMYDPPEALPPFSPV